MLCVVPFMIVLHKRLLALEANWTIMRMQRSTCTHHCLQICKQMQLHTYMLIYILTYTYIPKHAVCVYELLRGAVRTCTLPVLFWLTIIKSTIIFGELKYFQLNKL